MTIDLIIIMAIFFSGIVLFYSIGIIVWDKIFKPLLIKIGKIK